MENTSTPVSTTSVALRYGLLTGVISVIYSFILLASNLEQNTALALLSVIILIGGIFLAHKNFKENNSGFMSYGQGLGIGTLVSLVAGLLGGIFRYVYMEFIDPAAGQRALDQARAKLEEAGNMSDAQIDQAVQMSQRFSSGPIGIVVAVLGSALMGFLITLIIAAITKHNRPEFE
jgi:type IV secretory pathway VirB2 component (pilin)